MPQQTIFPAVRYADADAALTFLKDAFDAREHAIHRDEAGAIRHGQLLVSSSMVMIGESDPTGWMGGEPPRPLASTGSREYSVRDPEGNLWSFGTYDPFADS